MILGRKEAARKKVGPAFERMLNCRIQNLQKIIEVLVIKN